MGCAPVPFQRMQVVVASYKVPFDQQVRDRDEEEQIAQKILARILRMRTGSGRPVLAGARCL